MSLQRRNSTARAISRLAILLIAVMIMKLALAAPESEISVAATGGKSEAATEGDSPVKADGGPIFVPSERIPADQSISFPTDI